MDKIWDAPQYTCDYSQPASYRFSLDSVLLAKAAARELKSEQNIPANFRVLDLCAGCGVVGFELAHFEPRLKNFDFLEIQPAYHGHFEENLRRTSYLGIKAHWLAMNYRDLLTAKAHARGHYDLVISNPPYFEKDQGKIPPDELKARSRFFLDADFAELLQVIDAVLKPHGHAFVLVRNQDDHGRDRRQQIGSITPHLEILRVEDLRGTDLFHFRKLSHATASANRD